jgi:hypothetical protein
MWGALSDEKTGLSFTIATGPRQRSNSQVRVPWDCLRFETSFSSPPKTRLATVEVFDPASSRVWSWVHTKSTQRHITEDGSHHSHRCENFKSYNWNYSLLIHGCPYYLYCLELCATHSLISLSILTAAPWTVLYYMRPLEVRAPSYAPVLEVHGNCMCSTRLDALRTKLVSYSLLSSHYIKYGGLGLLSFPVLRWHFIPVCGNQASSYTSISSSCLLEIFLIFPLIFRSQIGDPIFTRLILPDVVWHGYLSHYCAHKALVLPCSLIVLHCYDRH